MKRLALYATTMIFGVALAGCANHGDGHHHHYHKHKHHYMTDDYDHKTYRHHDRRAHKMSHKVHFKSQHHTYRHHVDPYDQYPRTYYDTRRHAQTRITNTQFYDSGYESGCRTAATGGMYKNPKLHKDNDYYQQGWEDGFNQCHYNRTHINTGPSDFSYIPY